jgi:hypothetical protein
LGSAQKGEIEMTSKLFMAIKKKPIGAEWLNNSEAKGKAESIIKFLTARFEKPSAKLQMQIMSVKDIDKLDELTDFALSCVSLGEFATALN